MAALPKGVFNKKGITDAHDVLRWSFEALWLGTHPMVDHHGQVWGPGLPSVCVVLCCV